MSGLGRFRGRIAVLSGVIVVLLAAGTWVALTTASAKSTGSHATAQHSAAKAKAKVTAQKTVLTVASTTPEQHAQNVNGTTPVEVHFSAPLADGAPMPTITPDVAGSWSRVGTDGTIEFTPAVGFPANSYVQVHIPAGLRARGGGELAAPATMYFHTGAYSAARLPELLAQLGYLPLTWAPFAGQATPALGNAAAQLAAAYSAPAGSFTWQPGYPPGLTAFWDNGSPDGLILHGAIMAFESNAGLTMDGVAGPQVWAALLTAADGSKTNPNGYTYAVASQVYPETLTVYHDGKVILHTPANTGIPAAPTTVGTAPVYERLQSQIMKGLNPDGTKYADQVYWVSYFRAGEAVHYFPRGSYGYQQSLGCVELPYSTAKYIWPYLTYGTLVTVTPT